VSATRAAGDLPRDAVAALVALALLPGIGPSTLLGWLQDPGPAIAWGEVIAGRAAGLPGLHPPPRSTVAAMAVKAERVARSLDPGAVLDRHHTKGIQVLVHGQPGYPARLLRDPAPPAVLFVRGRAAGLDECSVAIVGTRNATQVGCRTAAELGRELAELGVSVVSGLALGIDGWAHRGVLDARPVHEPGMAVGDGWGPPLGVVACGLDRAYPVRHRQLHEQVAEAGALVSEHPIGTPPAPWRFPARNRIIAGLAGAVAVIESRSSGGSMLTVAEALARDRPVLAVPGHPSSPASAGSLDLLSEGALVLRDVQDVLVAIGRGGARPPRAPAPPGGAAGDGRPTDALARELLDLLETGPRSLEELVVASGCPVVQVAGAVDALVRCGRVARAGTWLQLAGELRGRG
jgi:DNA processing protein